MSDLVKVLKCPWSETCVLSFFFHLAAPTRSGKFLPLSLLQLGPQDSSPCKGGSATCRCWGAGRSLEVGVAPEWGFHMQPTRYRGSGAQDWGWGIQPVANWSALIHQHSSSRRVQGPYPQAHREKKTQYTLNLDRICPSLFCFFNLASFSPMPFVGILLDPSKILVENLHPKIPLQCG